MNGLKKISHLALYSAILMPGLLNAATIVNPSFEDGGEGTVPGWSGNSIWQSSSVQGYDGNRYMYLAETNHVLTQAITITPNKRYTLKFLAGVGNSGFNGQKASISYNTGTSTSVDITNNAYTAGFVEYTLTLEPEAGTDTLTIRLETNAGDFLKMDHFRITEETVAPPNPQTDLEISKSVSPTSLVSGDTATYTITISNNGPSDATAIEAIDQLPTGVTYSTHNVSQGSYNSSTGIWSVGDLANSATATLTIDVTAD